MVFIGLTALVATLGYLITPDATPYANDQYLELGLKKPGFSVMMLPVRENIVRVHTPFYKTMITGKAKSHLDVPVRSWMLRTNILYYIEIGRAHV